MQANPMQQELESSLLPAAPTSLEKAFTKLASGLPHGSAFEFQLPDRPALKVGSGNVNFRVLARNQRAVTALKSLDEMRIGEAYLFGDLDIEGDLIAALDLRNSFHDRHFLVSLWSVYGQRLFYGQTQGDKRWISAHYDAPPEFYLMFLDERFRCYSHGYFMRDDEPLTSAIERKLNTAFDSCEMQAGQRVLDIGAGWGAFTEFAGSRGVHVTSLTISEESEKYCKDLIAQKHLPCDVVREHFLEYRAQGPFDAIVNLGVTEHLPDYSASLKQYQRLLKPGGRVYADSCASRSKLPCASFVLKHIWPGNGQPMHLPSYVEAVAESPFEVCMVRNDRHNYLLTTKLWAEALDRNRERIVECWGEVLYRRFRLYLWGSVHGFMTDQITAYRWMLQLPVLGADRTALVREPPVGMLRSVRQKLRSN